MEKYDFLNDNIAIKEKLLIDNNKIIKENFIINKENIYNSYIKADTFSSLFSKKYSMGSEPNGDTIDVSVKPLPQGRVYDASKMWSPISNSGRIYEWNRGVIAIDPDGKEEKESLDRTVNHHADATIRVCESLGYTIKRTVAPFEAAIEATTLGLVVFQSEGDNAFVYFPEYITREQLLALGEAIVPRSGFNYSFTRGEEIFEEQNAEALIRYADSIRRTPVRVI